MSSDNFATDTLKALEKAFPGETAMQSLAETRKVEIKGSPHPVGEVIQETIPMWQWGAGTQRYKKWDGVKWIPATEEEYGIWFKKKKEGSNAPPVTDPQNSVDPPADDKKPTGGGNGTPVEPEPEPVNIPETEKLKDFGNKWESKNNNLRYPYERMESTQDYIQFSVIEYKRQGLTGGPVGTNRLNQGTGVQSQFSTQTPGRNLNTDILGTVTLPVPSQIGDNNGADYGSGGLNFLQERGLSIASAGIEGKFQQAVQETKGLFGDVVAGQRDAELVTSFFAGKAVSAFGGNLDLNQILARSSGTIINPNMELLFTGPKLRSFTFAFKFTPRFSKEAEEVRQIIRAFKKHSSPRKGGNFLKTPNIFQIRYLGEGGQNHQFLNRFKLCALTNMTVNYTGDGVYATYDNGTPVSSIMTLTFNELTPVYNEDYDENVGGVGY